VANKPTTTVSFVNLMLNPHSRVYLFERSGFVIAVHVPQQDMTWTEQGLRALVMACISRIPVLHMPVAVLHFLHDKTELTIGNTGDETLFELLKHQAEQPTALDDYISIAIDTIRKTKQFESQLECAMVTIEYEDENDLIECNEVGHYSAVSLRPVCSRFLDFCAQ
jgi:hypothetical protein